MIFDSSGDFHGSKIFKATSEEGRLIRELVKKARGTEMRRVKNTYVARLWLDDSPKAASTSTFPRQGA